MMPTLRWTVIGALFLIPFLPLYVANDMFFPFITSKGFWFRILVEVALAAFVVLACMDRKYRPQRSWTLLIYTGLVVWMFVANLFAVNAHKAFWSNYERMDGWMTLVHVFLFFVVASTFLSVERLWKKWWLTVLVGSFLVSAHGVLQLLGATEIHQGGVRVDANLGNAAYLGAYLLFSIAVAVWHGVESRGWLRYVLFLLAGLHTIILFSTATRGALLGLVGAAALAALLWSFSQGKGGRRVGVTVLVGIGILVAGFFALKDTSFVREDPTLSRIASISLTDGNTRFTLWQMAWQGFTERPVTGWGQEGYAYVFNKYYEPSLYAQEPWFDRAHSVYLDWLIAGGLPGFMLFIALLVAGAFGLLRSHASKAERILLAAALAAYAFQALFVFDNLMTYILVAAIFAAAHEATMRPWNFLEKAPVVSKSTAATVVAPVVLTLGVLTLWFVNVPGITGSTTLIRAVTSQNADTGLAYFREALESGTFARQEVREQLLSYAGGVVGRADVSQQTKEALLSLALSEAKKGVTEVPEDVRFRLQYAQGLEAAGNLTEAITETETALSYSPKKQGIYHQLGIGYWKAGDKETARRLFNESYELDTLNPEAALYLAAGDVITGRVEEGQALLQKHYGSTIVDYDLIRFAYYETKRYTDLVASAQLRRNTMPEDRAAVFLYVQALSLAGRTAEARAEVARATAVHPEWSAAAAQLLRELGI